MNGIMIRSLELQVEEWEKNLIREEEQEEAQGRDWRH